MSGWTTAEPEAGPDAIRGQITLTEEDVRQAVKEHSGLKWWHTVFIVPAALLAGLPAFKSGDAEQLIVIVIPMVFLLVLFSFALAFGFRRAGKQVLENKTEAERQLAFQFDASGYRITTPVSTASGQWSSVHRTQEGATTFFIYPATNVFQIVPKRALAEPDVARLRALLAQHVTPRATKYAGAGALKRTLILWVVLIIAFIAIWQFLGGENSRKHPRRQSEDVEETETPRQE